MEARTENKVEMRGKVPCYRALLKDELEKRRKRNSGYSLRSFARDLAVSPSFLSQVFAKKRGLTLSRAQEIARNLPWRQIQKEVFTSAVQWEGAHCSEIRKHLELKLRALNSPQKTSQVVSAKIVRNMTEWYFDAILELTEVEGFSPEPEWIAKRLGITAKQVQETLAALLSLGLLTWSSGKLCKVTEYSEVPDVPSKAMRDFHKKILVRAIRAQDVQSLKSRKSRVHTMAIDPNKLDQANELIRQFSKDMSALVENGKRSAVYHLAINFFRADKEESRNEEV